MPSLNINVTADTKAAQANLNSLAGNVKTFANELLRMANVSPKMAELGNAFAQIEQDFMDGKISIDAAREAVAKIEAEIASMGGVVEESGGKVKTFDQSWTELKSKIDLAGQTIQKVGQLFKQAFDLAKEGAQLKDTTASLQRLAEAAGVSGDIILKLENAAGGTVDDLAYMGSTIRLLTGETGDFAKALANASPQLLIIARAAVKLNPTLGTTAQAYEAITRAIETGQTRALKNYGIVLEDTENKQDALNQILLQGGVLIEQVGGNVETAVDDFSRFENAVDNLKDAGSLLAVEFLTPTVVGLGEVTNALATGTDVWDTYWSAVGEFNSGVGAGIGDFFGNMATGIENFVGQLLGLTSAQEGATNSFMFYSEAQRESNAAIAEGIPAYDALGEGLSNLEDSYAFQHTALQQQIDDFDKAAAEADAFQDRLNEVNTKAALLIETMQAAKPPIDEMLDALDQDIGSPLESFIKDLNFFIATGGADFAGALEEIQGALADKAITPEQAQQFSGELLASFESAKVAAGEIDFDEAAENLAEALGIPVDEAETLLTKFQDLELVKASLASGIAINVQAENLDTIVEGAGNLQEDLINLDNFEVAPVFQPKGLEETKKEIIATNEGALLAEESIAGMVEATGAAPEGAENMAPLSLGLGEVAASAIRAEIAIRNLIKTASQADFDAMDPFIADSPPPLGEGLKFIADIIPSVVSGFNAMGAAIDTIGGFGAGGLDLSALFENLKEDAEDFAAALFDAAGAFGGLANTAADLFEQQTLDPLKSQLEGIDEQIAAILEGETQDMYELARLTGERADVAREIAEQEERILKLQEQQQKIDFLSQQFELIKFLQENGLDPSSILSGIDLGANADPAALLDAMSKALEEILAKLGGELGGLGFQHGANFVVPPGYPGDSFGPMWASSGEHVSVTHGGEMGSGSQIVINMAGAIIMSQQEADRMMKTALDRAGGRADIYRRGG